MYREAVDYIRDKTSLRPSIGIILGSGLSDIGKLIENPHLIDYADIPGFPVSTVEGHAGRFIMGKFRDREIIVMQGRLHYYEGYEPAQIVLPIRTMKLLGVNTLIVTNAAGGIDVKFRPGDLMLIRDHINMSGINPLRGENDEKLGPRFPDMSNVYTLSLREKAHNIAKNLGIEIHEGVYAMMAGPSYETPAEVEFLSNIGVSAVGMSTVLEVIAAAHCDMEVIGISCITNMAAGISGGQLSHEEVVSTAHNAEDSLKKLMTGLIQSL